MELPILLAIDTTENWDRSDTALGESELAIELAKTGDGEEREKLLLVGDGNPVGGPGGVKRLRAKPGLIYGQQPGTEINSSSVTVPENDMADTQTDMDEKTDTIPALFNWLRGKITGALTMAHRVNGLIPENMTPDNQLADKLYVISKIVSLADAKADKHSPAFTGTPLAPTPSPVDNDTQIATMAAVHAVAEQKSRLQPGANNSMLRTIDGAVKWTPFPIPLGGELANPGGFPAPSSGAGMSGSYASGGYAPVSHIPAIGRNARAESEGAIAIGSSSFASGGRDGYDDGHSMAFGSSSQAWNGGMAYGQDSASLKEGGAAVGYKAVNDSVNGVTMGRECVSHGGNIVNVGCRNTALAADSSTPGYDYTVCIGGLNAALPDSVLIGRRIVDTSASVIAIGSPSEDIYAGEQISVTARGFGAVAIGKGVRVNGAGSVAIGQHVHAMNSDRGIGINYIVSIGAFSKAGGHNAVAVGASSAAALEGTAVGGDAGAAARGVAVGKKARTLQDNNTAVGCGALAGGYETVAVGGGAAATQANLYASGSVAIGVGAAAKDGSAVMGYQARADGADSVAVGSGATADNTGSVAVGKGAKAAAGSIAIGNGANAIRKDQIIIGPVELKRSVITVDFNSAGLNNIYSTMRKLGEVFPAITHTGKYRGFVMDTLNNWMTKISVWRGTSPPSVIYNAHFFEIDVVDLVSSYGVYAAFWYKNYSGSSSDGGYDSYVIENVDSFVTSLNDINNGLNITLPEMTPSYMTSVLQVLS